VAEGVTVPGRERLRPARGKLNARHLIVATTDADTLRVVVVAAVVASLAGLTTARAFTWLHLLTL
jgi:hypothetical protein